MTDHAAVITADPAAAPAASYDLIVIGGGVHGILLTLEACRHRLRPLLLERADFGGGTSHASLRILHGGLRYLQRLNLARSLESARERAWWRRQFPDLVETLPCLLPLDGVGPYRPAVLRPVLAVDALLARLASGTDGWPAGRTLDPEAVRRAAPALAAPDLAGGALWYDGFAPAAPRLLIETLRWACAAGAVALNHVEAVAPHAVAGRLRGVRARDVDSGAEYTFAAPLVINAAGAWARGFAAACGPDAPPLAHPVLAWNVVLRGPPPGAHALALRARRRGAQTYFLVPWKGAWLAGTGYAAWSGEGHPEALPAAQQARFVADLDEAAPGLGLAAAEVVRSFVGLLPARTPGGTDPGERPVIVDHGRAGGLRGLFSIAGVKLTTARALARRVLATILPGARPLSEDTFRRPPTPAVPDYPLAWRPTADDATWLAPLRRAIAEEAVRHLDDLLLRRSSLGDHPARALLLAPTACQLFDWDAARCTAELARLHRALRQAGGAAAGPTRQLRPQSAAAGPPPDQQKP